MSLDYKLTGRNICGIDEYSYDGVRFLFKPGNGKLIASFSAFTARGTEQKYNYLKDFNDSEFSILGFLDEDLPRSDPRGTYYLGREANGDYLKKIDAIVYDKSFTQRINEKDIWLIGSSKGATGALLLCFMFGYVNVFVNAPQYRIASYIKKRSEDIYEFLVEGCDSKKENIDAFVSKVICNIESLNLTITCGLDDTYHILELMLYEKEFLRHKIEYKKIMVPGGHDNESLLHYRNLLKNSIFLKP